MNRMSLVAVVLVTVLTVAGCSAGGEPGSTQAETSATASPDARAVLPVGNEIDAYYAQFEGYLLDDFPGDVVPLIDSLAIDTCIYSVRNDPQWVVVEGGLRNFYHVVYYSSATPEDVLDRYANLMEGIDAEKSFEGAVAGTMGPYDVFVNTSPAEKDTVVYLTVDLPRSEVSETNPFFTGYPAGLLELDPGFERFEHKYQVDSVDEGRFSYLEFYDMDITEEAFYAYYRERYGDRDDFTTAENGHVSWTDQGYLITLTYVDDHKRTYVSIARGM